MANQVPLELRALRIDPADNVAVALQDIGEGLLVAVEGGAVVARNLIPFAHKLALGRIARGSFVVKYGARIGMAIADIEPGEWVHEHNVESCFRASREGWT